MLIALKNNKHNLEEEFNSVETEFYKINNFQTWEDLITQKYDVLKSKLIN